jgi:hypothetical protein
MSFCLLLLSNIFTSMSLIICNINEILLFVRLMKAPIPPIFKDHACGKQITLDLRMETGHTFPERSL